MGGGSSEGINNIVVEYIYFAKSKDRTTAKRRYDEEDDTHEPLSIKG